MAKTLTRPLSVAAMALLGCVGVMVAILVKYAQTGYSCADALECTFHAVEMQASGTLFPPSWVATNFAHLQAIPLRLGLAFTSSYAVANLFCLFVMFLLALAALAIFWRKGLRDASGILLALFYIAPMSELSLQQLFTGAFYAQFAIIILLVVAAWLSACFDREPQAFHLRPAQIAVALVLTGAGCALAGVRLFLVLCIPIVGAVVWMSVFDRSVAHGEGRVRRTGPCVAVLAAVAGAVGCKAYEVFVAPAFGVPSMVHCADNIFYRLMGFLGAEVIFNHADYRLASSRVLHELEKFGEVNLFLRGIFPMLGFKTDTVTYERHERLAGNSHYPLLKMLNFAWDGITSLSIRPIRLISVLGGVTVLMSLAMIGWCLISYCRGQVVPGWSSNVIVSCLIGGVQLLSLGVIGEYVGKVYMETKRRPRYIVSDRVNCK